MEALWGWSVSHKNKNYSTWCFSWFDPVELLMLTEPNQRAILLLEGSWRGESRSLKMIYMSLVTVWATIKVCSRVLWDYNKYLTKPSWKETNHSKCFTIETKSARETLWIISIDLVNHVKESNLSTRGLEKAHKEWKTKWLFLAMLKRCKC